MGIIVPTGKSGIFGDKKKHKRARAGLTYSCATRTRT